VRCKDKIKVQGSFIRISVRGWRMFSVRGTEAAAPLPECLPITIHSELGSHAREYSIVAAMCDLTSTQVRQTRVLFSADQVLNQSPHIACAGAGP
jgi:hypothetical protein